MYPSGFDRPDSESPFLSFVAQEYAQRGTERRKDLAQKLISHPFVSQLGMRVPQAFGVIDDVRELHSMALPRRFVLKLTHGWSSRGVMLLERFGEDAYFDHMSLRSYSKADIADVQARIADSFGFADKQWLVEELIEPTVNIGAVPFDYKFYCFDGRIGLITQIDRNSGPAKVAFFDGRFKPMRYGRDYLFGPSAKPGTPLIPLHAAEMMWWAQKLSTEADSPFVSVDMLDSYDGPVFSEFTYSPGGTHRRMYGFSHGLIDRFDSLIDGKDIQPDDLRPSPLELRKSLTRAPAHAYKSWAGYAYNGGPRGAERLHNFYKAESRNVDCSDSARDWNRRIGGLWGAIRDSLHVRNRRSGAKYHLEARMSEKTITTHTEDH